MKKGILLLAFFTLSATFGYSQNCVQNLEAAQQRYDEGRIQDIEGLLKSCVRQNVFTKAEQAQAHRLLTLAYIYLEESTEAEYHMLELLKTYHEFEINPAIDPTEFINLHKRFRTKPLFNIGARYIVNFTQPMVTELNGSFDLSGDNADRGTYNTVFNFIGFGLNFEYPLSDHWVLYPELQYSSKSIEKITTQAGLTTDEPYFTLTNFESQSWFSVPVSIKYLFNVSRAFKLYLNVGASFDYLVAASKPGDNAQLEVFGAAPVSFTIEKQNDHNRINFAVLGGGGATYKIGEGFLSLEARYSYGLTQVSNPSQALIPSDGRQLGNMLIQDDGYSLNNIYVSLGYTANIYIPKKLR